jgi:hypothetical protein
MVSFGRSLKLEWRYLEEFPYVFRLLQHNDVHWPVFKTKYGSILVRPCIEAACQEGFFSRRLVQVTNAWQDRGPWWKASWSEGREDETGYIDEDNSRENEDSVDK